MQKENKNIKRDIFDKEIQEYKANCKEKNQVKDFIVEIKVNLFDNISKSKRNSFVNEYLRKEIQGKDFYINDNKIIANGITKGKLKNGNTNFDKKIEKSLRLELKFNIIANFENIIKTSIVIGNKPDIKNHSFADSFERRKSIVRYKEKNYEVMFEIGIKGDINTLYGIESIKRTQKNRLSLPKRT